MMNNNMYFSELQILWKLFSEIPTATAHIRGSRDYPDIKGIAQFYQTPQGVLIATELMQLPTGKNACEKGIYAVHIHEGVECSGNEADPFAMAGTHYNLGDCEHPYHAGDMPPLFENDGYALTVFLTNRFRVSDVLGKTVIVHYKRDDFTSQPAGDSGRKIACGKIVPVLSS